MTNGASEISSVPAREGHGIAYKLGCAVLGGIGLLFLFIAGMVWRDARFNDALERRGWGVTNTGWYGDRIFQAFVVDHEGPIMDEDIKLLGRLEKTTYLILRGEGFDDAGLQRVCALKNVCGTIETLVLCHTSVTSIEPAKTMKGTLVISFSPAIHDLSPLIGSGKRVSIRGVTGVTEIPAELRETVRFEEVAYAGMECSYR